MRIQLVTPAPRGSRTGNRVTALRWARQLRSLGHRVRVREELDGAPCDLLVALHARRSADSVMRSRQAAPSRPVVLVLTGTDVYDDLRWSSEAQAALAQADRVVTLQAAALQELAPEVRARALVIPQSARAVGSPREQDAAYFDALVIAHLRAVKNPLLAAHAARRAPRESRLRVRLVGEALEPELGREAEREARENPRFEWLGPQPFSETACLLSAARVLVVSSQDEGGPAVVTEAIAAGTPVLSTRIPSVESLLGAAYPGFYERGDEAGLAALLLRCELEPAFLGELRSRVLVHQAEVSPELERERLCELLSGLAITEDRADIG